MQFHNLLCLIVDEADRILEIGFEVRQFSVLTRLQMIAQLNLLRKCRKKCTKLSSSFQKVRLRVSSCGIFLTPSFAMAERQTMLFSATQTTKVEDLVKLALDKTPMYIGVQEDTEFSTVFCTTTIHQFQVHVWIGNLRYHMWQVKGLEQGYVVCQNDIRFLLLFTFLKKNLNKRKIIVFFSSCNAVRLGHHRIMSSVSPR